MQTRFQPLPPRPSSPSPLPFIIIIVILVLLLIGLGIWLVLLLTKPKTTATPSCPPEQTTAPVYLYGFAPGPSPREISASSGVLTPSNGTLRLSPLNQAGPQNQQWRLVTQGTSVLLQHVSTSQYVTGTGGLSDNLSEAINLTLYGPFRNGRAYFLRLDRSYLTTNEDLTVTISQQSGTIPLSAEWMIVLGPCQSTGSGGC